MKMVTGPGVDTVVCLQS